MFFKYFLPKYSELRFSKVMIFFSLFTRPPSWSISIGYFLSWKIFLIDEVKLNVCLIFLIFLVNKIVPQVLYFYKKNFSFEDNLVDLIPIIKDRRLFIIF